MNKETMEETKDGFFDKLTDEETILYKAVLDHFNLEHICELEGGKTRWVTKVKEKDGFHWEYALKSDRPAASLYAEYFHKKGLDTKNEIEIVDKILKLMEELKTEFTECKLTTPFKFINMSKDLKCIAGEGIAYLEKFYSDITLADIIEGNEKKKIDKRQLTKKEAGIIFRNLVKADSTLINAGIYHRDLNAKNILIQISAEGNMDSRLTDYANAATIDHIKSKKSKGDFSFPTCSCRNNIDLDLYINKNAEYDQKSEMREIGFTMLYALTGKKSFYSNPLNGEAYYGLSKDEEEGLKKIDGLLMCAEKYKKKAEKDKTKAKEYKAKAEEIEQEAKKIKEGLEDKISAKSLIGKNKKLNEDNVNKLIEQEIAAIPEIYAEFRDVVRKCLKKEYNEISQLQKELGNINIFRPQTISANTNAPEVKKELEKTKEKTKKKINWKFVATDAVAIFSALYISAYGYCKDLVSEWMKKQTIISVTELATNDYFKRDVCDSLNQIGIGDIGAAVALRLDKTGKVEELRKEYHAKGKKLTWKDLRNDANNYEPRLSYFMRHQPELYMALGDQFGRLPPETIIDEDFKGAIIFEDRNKDSMIRIKLDTVVINDRDEFAQYIKKRDLERQRVIATKHLDPKAYNRFMKGRDLIEVYNDSASFQNRMKQLKK